MELLGSYHENIPNNTYHGLKDYFSSSQVKQAIDSHAHFRYYLENGKQEESKWTPDSARDYGSLVHALALEFPTDPGIIEREFAFMDVIGKNFRTKEDRQYKAQFLSKNEDKIVVPAHRLPEAKLAVEAIKDHSFARELICEKGISEYSGFSKDPDYDLYIRTRVDRLNLKYGLVDLKTTDNIEDFLYIAKWVWHYDLSGWMYCRNHELLTGEWPDWYFVVVDSQNRVAVFKATKDGDFFQGKGKHKGGKKKYEMAMKNIQKALDIKEEKVRYQEVDFEEI